jgi:hypothetical protein
MSVEVDNPLGGPEVPADKDMKTEGARVKEVNEQWMS